MLKIVRNIAILFGLIILLNWVLFEGLTCIFHYHPEWKEKQKLYQNNKGYNSVILGSSRTFYCINPGILNANTLQSDSFYNMGVPFLTFPNSYLYACELLESPHPPDLLLIELSYYPNADLQQMHSAYEIYFENKKRNYIPNLNHSKMEELKSFFEPLLNFNWPKYLRKNGLAQGVRNGYISLDSMAKTDKTAAINHQQYLQNEVLSEDQNDPNRFVESKITKTESKELYFWVQNLLTQAQSTKTAIYFFMPNRISPTELGIVYPVYRLLPEWAKLNPTATVTGKTLIQARYSWDLGHLNKAGADIYSQLFAEELNKKQALKK